jgi:hypothetical protein
LGVWCRERSVTAADVAGLVFIRLREVPNRLNEERTALASFRASPIRAGCTDAQRCNPPYRQPPRERLREIPAVVTLSMTGIRAETPLAAIRHFTGRVGVTTRVMLGRCNKWTAK